MRAGATQQTPKFFSLFGPPMMILECSYLGKKVWLTGIEVHLSKDKVYIDHLDTDIQYNIIVGVNDKVSQ